MMIKEIVHDPFLLSQKAEPAGIIDTAIGKDMVDTLLAHKDHCVGIAANMIGVNKAIICVMIGDICTLMYNPVILSKKGEYTAKEGCLSLPGIRETKRYREIRVRYQNAQMKKCETVFTGFAAQTIQHEIDHVQGILI